MNGLADGSASTLLFLAALCATILILLRRWSRYYRRRPRDTSPLVHVKRPNQTDRSRPRDADAERIRAEVALHETARELSAKLDSKIRVLEYLTGTAEGQIRRLEALLDEARRVGSAETAGRSEKRECPGASVSQNGSSAE
ncbi:MAG: hypothetical protein ACC645_16270 [Pirellulales bacterium]